MELLGDEAQLEPHFDPSGDSANLDARSVHGLRRMYHKLRNRFGRTRWYSYVTRLNWKIDSICLEIVLMLSQKKCTVCVEHIIGSKTVLDAPDGTPR